ncbi:uncharacterized protein A4U43_C01F8340 [Asparagus officinalis]|uniref:Serine aminopeptidase S33 domain-containing protein n=1 Tax=Asparagus officinalis TaxID=4686 RepID=A0A5P1FSE6_ASPOF|nr:uncharacterized protein A4U43_C01F8340 [Asparagus officinalis]
MVSPSPRPVNLAHLHPAVGPAPPAAVAGLVAVVRARFTESHPGSSRLTAAYLVEHGFAVAALDHRGHGLLATPLAPTSANMRTYGLMRRLRSYFDSVRDGHDPALPAFI